MEFIMYFLVVFCVVGSLVGLCLARYAKIEFEKVFPKEYGNNGMLGFGSEFLLYDQSVPCSTQKLFLTSKILYLTATLSGLIASIYFANYGWTKTLLFPSFLTLYGGIKHSCYFVKSRKYLQTVR